MERLCLEGPLDDAYTHECFSGVFVLVITTIQNSLRMDARVVLIEDAASVESSFRVGYNAKTKYW